MIQIIFTLLGIVAVLCIPALWVSWNEAIYYGVLLTFFGVVGVIVVIAWLFPEKVLVQIPANGLAGDDDAPDPAPGGDGSPSRHWYAAGNKDANDRKG